MKTRKYFEQNRIAAFVGFTLILVLVIGLAIIIPFAGRSGTSTTKLTTTPTTGVVTPTPTSAENTPAPSPGVVMGPQACPVAVNDLANWDAILETQGSDSKVIGLSCANLMGNSSLQALVMVRHSDANSTLDVYMFNDLTSSKPTQIFKAQGLLKGDAKISGYNSVMTAEVDVNSSINTGKLEAGLTTDLYREFKWSDGAETFAQIAFRGLYPDLTRFQAELDQVSVNGGKDAWKLNALETTNHFAQALLRTPPDSAITLVSGGGTHDVDAVVYVTPSILNGGGGPFPPIKVTLSRLEGNTNSGIWVVVGVESANKAITAPQNGDSLSSPVAVTGTGSQFESQVGIVHILDHLYTDIGHTIAVGSSGFGSGPFSVKVLYASSFHGGAQEGIVVLYDENGGGTSLRGGVAMAKVLLS
jgi:hypothetical protein